MTNENQQERPQGLRDFARARLIHAGWADYGLLYWLSGVGAVRIALRAPHYLGFPALVLFVVSCAATWSAALDVISWPTALLLVVQAIGIMAALWLVGLGIFTAWRLLDPRRVILLTTMRDAVVDVRLQPDGALSFSEHNVRRVGAGQGKALRHALAQEVRALEPLVRLRAENTKVAQLYLQQFTELEVVGEPDRLGRITLQRHLDGQTLSHPRDDGRDTRTE